MCPQAVFHLDAVEEHLFPYFLLPSSDCLHSLTHAPPHPDFFFLKPLSLLLTLLAPSPEDPCDYIGPTQNNGLVQNWERSMSRLYIVTLLI